MLTNNLFSDKKDKKGKNLVFILLCVALLGLISVFTVFLGVNGSLQEVHAIVIDASSGTAYEYRLSYTVRKLVPCANEHPMQFLFWPKRNGQNLSIIPSRQQADFVVNRQSGRLSISVENFTVDCDVYSVELIRKFDSGGIGDRFSYFFHVHGYEVVAFFGRGSWQYMGHFRHTPFYGRWSYAILILIAEIIRCLCI